MLRNMNHRFVSSLCVSFAALLSPATASAAPIILYNSTTGQKPQDQGWFYNADNGTFGQPAASVIETNLANTMLLDTADPITDRAGYIRSSLLGNIPVGVHFDRMQGYALSINAQVFNESHATNDRAGFSLLVLGSDNFGVELGFWSDRIFAQSTTFTHVEEALYDNTQVISNYTLSVFENTYSFFAPGLATPLTGPLRKYPTAGFPTDPYGLSNFLYFGDNTRSAEAQVNFTQISYSPVAIPEPSCLLCGAAGLVALGLWRRR